VAQLGMSAHIGRLRVSTFTGPNGQYRFYGAAPSPGTVSVDTQQFTVVVGPEEPGKTLQVTA
jgi:hypothetical protein